MGFLSFVRLFSKLAKPADVAAFILSALLGYLAASFLPEGAWASYTFILLSYHLFLTWLVIDADRKRGVALPILPAILTHLACLALIVTVGMGRNSIPFYAFLRFGIAGLALFERDWIFSVGRKVEEEYPATAPVSAVVAEASADDHDAWLQHLAQRNPLSRKPGMSIQDEYQEFLAARSKNRLAKS